MSPPPQTRFADEGISMVEPRWLRPKRGLTCTLLQIFGVSSCAAPLVRHRLKVPHCEPAHFFLPPAAASSLRSQEITLPSMTTPLPSMKATRERPSQFLKVSH